MTALAKLFRTTVFKVSLAYLVISAIGAGMVLSSVGDNVKMLIDQQIGQTVDADESPDYQNNIRKAASAILSRASKTALNGRALISIFSRLPQASRSPAISPICRKAS